MNFLTAAIGAATTKTQQEPLAPTPYPIGCFPAYISGTPVTLKLREKAISLSGDSFAITTAPGDQPVFNCTGTVLSLHSKKYFKTPTGTPLLTLSKKLIAIHTTFDALPGDGSSSDSLFRVRAHWNPFGGAKLSVTFMNICGATPDQKKETTLWLKGDLFDRNAKITLGENGPVVGRIDRDFMNLGQVFRDKQTYYLTVAPGMDGLVLAALCVCLDEKANDPK